MNGHWSAGFILRNKTYIFSHLKVSKIQQVCGLCVAPWPILSLGHFVPKIKGESFSIA